MIKPTVGRVVWFRDNNEEFLSAQPQAAIICYVHTDHLVNLVVFDSHGVADNYEEIILVQEGENPPYRAMYCEWMPYQIGQAKKDTTTV